MRLKAGLFSLVCALVSTSAIAKDIASTSLCGDAYVLAITPDRVSALSWQSRDPISRAPQDKQALPQAWDDPERLIALKPDVVVFGSGEGFKHADIMAKTDMDTIAVQWGEDFDAVRVNYQDIAKKLGVSSGQHILDLNQRLTTLENRAIKRGRKPAVLYVARSGGSAGEDTLVDAAIKAAGGYNALPAKGWSNHDLESIIKLEPDLIVTSYFSDGYESVQAVGVRHKVMRDFLNAHPRVEIPGSLWPCAGPGLIEAAELIADTLDKLP